MITGFSIDFLVAGIAHSSLPSAKRAIWIRIAMIHSVAYFIFLFIGVVTPIYYVGHL
ncbi:MAG: hypothetical protein MZU97_06070 [Bacillus subtilis]|nr:hypothetical protein [Bacillus subtilis]